ncbi:DUF3592 domain-containing protein [Prosthecobacter vanneervenii]|uniref:DUF3592 domain-containing protein n=1 Tax=Prosthecobacter vanneervenii TaxID=48466 RepID=A0A7W7YAM3_9BACT|nr:DUF3592 domain-containing protein [Prosthecobacter vanneervenii]MBB5032472.1 hypothetical protein [Prosthecobacter vanneervenii]
MEGSSKIKVFAAIGVIAGPFLAYNGYQEQERLARLEKEGVTVGGFIEGGEWRKSRRSSSYKLDVSFTPKNGTPTRQTFDVKSQFFSAHASDTAVTDPVVKVRYLPSSVQESAVIEGGSTDTTFNYSFGIGAFVVGLLTLGIMSFFKG